MRSHVGIYVSAIQVVLSLVGLAYFYLVFMEFEGVTEGIALLISLPALTFSILGIMFLIHFSTRNKQ